VGYHEVYARAEREYGMQNKFVRALCHFISEAKSRISEVLRSTGGPIIKLFGPAINEVIQLARQGTEYAKAVFEDVIETGAAGGVNTPCSLQPHALLRYVSMHNSDEDERTIFCSIGSGDHGRWIV
jgi:hypothetical protein